MGFVFLIFSVILLSLVLQPCAIAAATSVDIPINSVVDIRESGSPSGAQQVVGCDDCLSASVTNEFCCGTSAIHERSETPKLDSTHKDNIDQPDSFTTNCVTWTMSELSLVDERAGNSWSAKVLPPGPPINIRNCVYLI